MLRSELLEGDHVVLHRVPSDLGRVPVEDPEVFLKVGEPEVDRTRGEDIVTLQEAAAELGHVVEAVEVLEVDVGDVAGTELLAERRQSNPGTALGVVSPVRQAAEHLTVPRGADHHVRQLGRPDVVRVTELVEASENIC